MCAAGARVKRDRFWGGGVEAATCVSWLMAAGSGEGRQKREGGVRLS